MKVFGRSNRIFLDSQRWRVPVGTGKPFVLRACGTVRRGVHA